MKLRKSRSFTIVEALIATTLFIIIIIAFFASLSTSFHYLRRVMELRTASLALQEEVSIVRNLKFSEIESLGGTFSTSSMSSLNNATGAITKPYYYGTQGKVLKVTFKLDWVAFDSVPMTKSVVTLITDHGIDKR